MSIKATESFTSASYTFDQGNTPNHAVLIGTNNLLGGAQFSAGKPTEVTSDVKFPQGATNFNGALSLGRLVGLATNGVRAVNLPNGNNGTSTRHGVEVFWDNRAVPNSGGPDFVIYESASSSNAVEGVMARARITPTETWTAWYYFVPDAFQSTTNAEGVFSYGYDLSDMGVPVNASVDKIQLANLTAADRIQTTNAVNVGGTLVGEGEVVFDGSSNILPDAGTFDSNRVFDSTTYDPDPLYVASLQNVCETTAPSLAINQSGAAIFVTWPAPSCYQLQSSQSVAGTWSNVVNSVAVTNGLNVVAMTATNAQTYFRLSK